MAPTAMLKASGNSHAVDIDLHSFVDLPGEIRNRIYDFVLKHDDAIRIIGVKS